MEDGERERRKEVGGEYTRTYIVHKKGVLGVYCACMLVHKARVAMVSLIDRRALTN